MAYDPTGLQFKNLEKLVKRGNKYYVVKYWTRLVCEYSTRPRSIEYKTLAEARKAFNKLKELDRAYSLEEYTFVGDTWEEHAHNFHEMTITLIDE